MFTESLRKKSINRKGAQALRDSQVGYFSAVATLRDELCALCG